MKSVGSFERGISDDIIYQQATETSRPCYSKRIGFRGELYTKWSESRERMSGRRTVGSSNTTISGVQTMMAV